MLYRGTKIAWFNRDIFHDWFHHHLIPAAKNFHEQEKRIQPEHVKAILLLDNSPAHPVEEDLSSRCDKIKVMFLPARTTTSV